MIFPNRFLWPVKAVRLLRIEWQTWWSGSAVAHGIAAIIPAAWIDEYCGRENPGFGRKILNWLVRRSGVIPGNGDADHALCSNRLNDGLGAVSARHGSEEAPNRPELAVSRGDTVGGGTRDGAPSPFAEIEKSKI